MQAASCRLRFTITSASLGRFLLHYKPRCSHALARASLVWEAPRVKLWEFAQDVDLGDRLGEAHCQERAPWEFSLRKRTRRSDSGESRCAGPARKPQRRLPRKTWRRHPCASKSESWASGPPVPLKSERSLRGASGFSQAPTPPPSTFSGWPTKLNPKSFSSCADASGLRFACHLCSSAGELLAFTRSYMLHGRSAATDCPLAISQASEVS